MKQLLKEAIISVLLVLLFGFFESPLLLLPCGYLCYLLLDWETYIKK